MENRKKQLAGNTAILMIGKICTQFISFFMLPLYTALLSSEEYGIVDLFHTYVTLLLPIIGLQLDLGVFRFMLDFRSDETKKKELFSSALICNLIGIIIYAIIYALIQSFINSEYKIFLLYHVVLNVFSSLMLQFARGQGNNVHYAIGSFLTASVTVLLNVLFVAVLKIGAVGMFWSTVGGQIVAIVYLFIVEKIWKYVDFSAFNKKTLKEVLRYSLPLIPTNLSWWVISASDRSIISYMMSIAANGIFAVASKFSALINVFYNVFNMAWTETVSLHINDKDRDDFLSGTVNELYNFFFSICAGIIALMPFVFRFFVNEQYNEAYLYIPILMIAMFAQIVCGLFSVVFMAKKDTKENAKTACLAALINIISNIVFIKWLGLYAAAGSTLIAYSAMAVFRYVSIRKYVNIQIKKISFLTSLIICTIACTAYYYDSISIKLISLIIVVFYATLANINMIKSIFATISGVFKKHS